MTSRVESLLAHSAARHPAALAVRDAVGAWTYGELASATEDLAAGLRALGVAAGDRVAVLARNRAETVALYFACARLGAVILPVSWRLAPTEVVWILGHAGARALVAEPRFVRALGAEVPAVCSLRLVLESQGDGEPLTGWLPFAAAVQPKAARALPRDTPASEPAVQMYTSGTTGRPKGATLSHDAVTSMAAAWLADMPLVAGTSAGQSRFMQVTPLFHVGGMLMVMSVVAGGGALVLLPEFDPVLALATLVAERVTHTLMVPAMVQWALYEHRLAPREYPDLTLLAYGAAPMPTATLLEARDVFRCDFLQGYGLTETAGVVTTLTPADHRWPAGTPPPPRLASAGRAARCSEVRVVDDEGVERPRGRAGEDPPAACIGELVARGSNLMLGYHDDAAGTAVAFRGDWFRTGDLGWVDQEGYIYVVDRCKDMILVGGENVYPREVELRLCEHPDVHDAAVIGVPHDTWGEEVLAFVVAAPGRTLEPRALARHCRERLARFKCPTRFELVATLPRNAAGKLQKAALRAPYWSGRARQV